MELTKIEVSFRHPSLKVPQLFFKEKSTDRLFIFKKQIILLQLSPNLYCDLTMTISCVFFLLLLKRSCRPIM